MTRAVCPYCGSSTGFGSNICFKCGVVHTKDGTLTPGFLHVHTTTNELLKLRDDVIFDVSQFPAAALKWLYSAGIYNEDIQRQRIGYCTEANRVLIPAFDDVNVLHFYQMRQIADDDINQVKYYSKGSINRFTIHYRDFKNDSVVIVEDHLSAIRIRKHSNVLALSGTKLRNEVCKSLAVDYSTFIFWLDADKPGQQSTVSNYIKLRQYCTQYAIESLFKTSKCKDYSFWKVNCSTIVQDPKRFLDSEIQNILTHEVIKCG